MPVITLPDGSKREYAQALTVAEVAASIGAGLAKAAIAKVKLNTPLVSGESEVVKRALVIGGGIAGLQTALDIAEAGYKVDIVEKSPSIGGKTPSFGTGGSGVTWTVVEPTRPVPSPRLWMMRAPCMPFCSWSRVCEWYH